jgi:hypothetical protein
MTTRRLVLAALGLLLAAGTVALTGSRAITGPATIRITTQQLRSASVDVGTSGRSPGDLEIVSLLLYNRRITPKSIGKAELICTYTFGPARMCRGTFFMPRGRLIVEGSLRNREIYQLAITGGTELYDNARGSLTVTRIQKKPRRELAYFRLTG